MGARAHSTLVLYSIVVGANQYRLNSVFNYQRFGLNSFSNGYQRHQYLRAEQIIVKLSFLQFSIFTTWPWSSLLQSRNMTNQTDFVETLYIPSSTKTDAYADCQGFPCVRRVRSNARARSKQKVTAAAGYPIGSGRLSVRCCCARISTQRRDKCASFHLLQTLFHTFDKLYHKVKTGWISLWFDKEQSIADWITVSFIDDFIKWIIHESYCKRLCHISLVSGCN
jgi:hypothetical protein